MRSIAIRHLRRSILPLLLVPCLLLRVPLPAVRAAPLVQETSTCDTLNQEGMVLLRQAHYRDALQQFQDALTCYRKAADRKGEGTALNNMGSAYDSLGQYQEALNTYQQALAIAQEIGNRAGEGATLNNIGLVYRHRGQYQEALQYYQQALAIRQEIGDRAEEGTTLNNIGVIYERMRQYQQALDAYQQALAIVQELGDRAREGQTLNHIGVVCYHLGQYQEALNYLQQALAIRQEIGDNGGVGTTFNNLGAIYDSLGQHQEALECYRQALAILREVGDRAGEGTTLNNIGGAYDSLGQYQEALDTYQQALAIRREVGDRAGEGVTLHNLGLVYRHRGQYQEALEYYQQALIIAQKLSDRAGEGTTLNNVGGIYNSLGQYQEALDTYQQALAIVQELGDRAGEGQTLDGIGTVYGSLGQYQEALDYFQRALAIAQEISDRTGVGATLNNIGSTYGSLGQYQEALDYYQQALAIRQEIGDRAGEGDTLNGIGVIYYGLGRYQEALDYYQRALAIRQGIGDRVGECITLNNIGFTYERQNQPEQALLHYEQAMTMLEAVRATAGGEAGRSSFIAQYAGLYDHAVNLYHAQGQDEQAFFTTERGRARAFLDTMSTGYVQLSDNVSADLLTRERESYSFRLATQEALSRARAQQPPDTALIADLEAQLATAENEYAAAQAAIQERHDQLAALVPGRGAVLDLPQVQALLDDQTTLLSFWVLEEQTLAFVVTRDSLHTVALQIRQTELEAQTVLFRSFPNLDAALPDSAVALYAALIAPLEEYLSTPHLMIVPHNVLHYLPFGALTDGQRYLVDDYTITYLPSASVLPFIQKNAGAEEGVPLILGNPTTGDFDTAVLITERGGLGPLPYAEAEAQAIATLYGTTPLLGAAATESAVREQSGKAKIVHLAAHGYYNPIAPLQSLIALAPDETNDGWLTVGEVYGLDLQGTDLVVLSACQSHLGDLSAGDELVGLTRALFFAGTPTVVASLWTVDDEATAQLMERFYVHLQAGMGKAEALRQAQLDIRADYPNPYYWAGFVLSGEGVASVVVIAPRAVAIPPWAWAGGGALLLAVLGGGGLWFLKRRRGRIT